MIELYGMSSPNVFKVSIMLEEVGLPWTLKRIDIVKGDQFAPEFLAIGPNNKVPVIVDPKGPNGAPFSVFESGAILVYLADKTRKLVSPDPAKRSVQLQWLMFQMASLGPMLGQLNHYLRYQPPGRDYPLERYTSEVLRIFGVINTRLGVAEYLGGDDVSFADVAALPWMRVPMNYQPGFQGKQFAEAYQAYPNIVRWMAVMLDRPGVKKGIASLETQVRAKDLASFDSATHEEIDRLLGRGKFART